MEDASRGKARFYLQTKTHHEYHNLSSMEITLDHYTTHCLHTGMHAMIKAMNDYTGMTGRVQHLLSGTGSEAGSEAGSGPGSGAGLGPGFGAGSSSSHTHLAES